MNTRILSLVLTTVVISTAACESRQEASYERVASAINKEIDVRLHDDYSNIMGRHDPVELNITCSHSAWDLFSITDVSDEIRASGAQTNLIEDARTLIMDLSNLCNSQRGDVCATFCKGGWTDLNRDLATMNRQSLEYGVTSKTLDTAPAPATSDE